jgi:hypothetical protein
MADADAGVVVDLTLIEVLSFTQFGAVLAPETPLGFIGLRVRPRFGLMRPNPTINLRQKASTRIASLACIDRAHRAHQEASRTYVRWMTGSSTQQAPPPPTTLGAPWGPLGQTTRLRRCQTPALRAWHPERGAEAPQACPAAWNTWVGWGSMPVFFSPGIAGPPVSHPTCHVPFPPRRTGRYRKGMISAHPYQGFRRSGWDPETFRRSGWDPETFAPGQKSRAEARPTGRAVSRERLGDCDGPMAV